MTKCVTDPGNKGQLIDRLRVADPRDFEYFVADLWSRRGWDAEVRQEGADAGVDIMARRKESDVVQSTVIQTKRYRENNPVSSPEIQQYASLRLQENIESIIVVTTSRFTDPAQKRADDLNVDLVDSNDLVSVIAEQKAYDLVDEYAPRSPEAYTLRPGDRIEAGYGERTVTATVIDTYKDQDEYVVAIQTESGIEMTMAAENLKRKL